MEGDLKGIKFELPSVACLRRIENEKNTGKNDKVNRKIVRMKKRDTIIAKQKAMERWVE